MNTRVQFQAGPEITTVQVERTGNAFRVTIGTRVYAVQAEHAANGQLDLTVDGRHVRSYVAQREGQSYVWLAGQVWRLQKPATNAAAHHVRNVADTSGQIVATMPGLVQAVLAASGDQVMQGAPLVILEAMKMELRLTAPLDGTVTAVHCTPGQVVQRGQLLVTFTRNSTSFLT